MKPQKRRGRISKGLAAVAPVVVLLLVAERPTQAYIDPGTGSYVTQVIIATIVSAGFVLRSYWSRVKDRCRRLFTKGRGSIDSQ